MPWAMCPQSPGVALRSGLRRCVGCARGGHPRRAHHVRRVPAFTAGGTFAAWLAAIRIRCGGAHVGQCFCGCCVGIAVQCGIAAVFGVAAATAVAAFTRLAVAVFTFGAAVAIAGARPSVPFVAAATAFAGAACGVTVAFAGGVARTIAGAIPSATSVGLRHLGHHGGHRRAHCLQPGLLAQGAATGLEQVPRQSRTGS